MVLVIDDLDVSVTNFFTSHVFVYFIFLWSAQDLMLKVKYYCCIRYSVGNSHMLLLRYLILFLRRLGRLCIEYIRGNCERGKEKLSINKHVNHILVKE